MIQKFAPGHSSVVSTCGRGNPRVVGGKQAPVARNDSQRGVKHASLSVRFKRAANTDFRWFVHSWITVQSQQTAQFSGSMKKK